MNTPKQLSKQLIEQIEQEGMSVVFGGEVPPSDAVNNNPEGLCTAINRQKNCEVINNGTNCTVINNTRDMCAEINSFWNCADTKLV